MKKVAKMMIVLMTLALMSVSMCVRAGTNDVMACSVTVTNKSNDVLRFQYIRDFNVSVQQNYFEDLSTSLRQGSFAASLSYDGNVPVVTVSFDRDVSALNYAAFDVDMAMMNPSNGQTQKGGNSFYMSIPSVGSTHYRTDYELTCHKD